MKRIVTLIGTAFQRLVRYLRLRPKDSGTAEEQPTLPLINNVSRADIERFVYFDDTEVRHSFQRELEPDIERVVASLDRAGQALVSFERNIDGTDQTLYVLVFLFRAFDSIAGSLRLIVGGSQALAEHQMRHFGESFSMALLCCDQPRIGREYDKGKFPVHKAVDRVNQKKVRKRLDLNASGTESLRTITNSFNRSSHATVRVEALSVRTRDFEGLQLSREYDPHRKQGYERLLGLQTAAGGLLADSIGHLIERLQAKQARPDVEPLQPIP